MLGVGWLVAALVALHFLDSDLSVTDTYTSDYALGDYGWLMRSAFFAVGVGTVAIGLGLRETLAPGKRVTASVVLFLIAGVAFLVGGIFNTDPTGVTDLSATGTVHVLASAVLFLSLLVSAWFLRGVFKRDPSWQWFSKAQLGFAVAYTAALIVSFATPEGGTVGLTQRIGIAVLMAWLATLGWSIRRVDSAAKTP
jgi:hypothetical membrane protein